MKESNTIRRIPPCAAYDVEGMESPQPPGIRPDRPRWGDL